MPEFETIYRHYSGFIYKFLLKCSHDPQTAEELTQETFFRAYMNLPQLRDPSRLPAWLCRIARNCWFAWLRQSQKTLPLDEAQALSSEKTPETLYLTQEVFQQLEQLEEPYREVLLLSVFGGVSLKEISKLFGKSESWARVTLHRARQKLLERIG